MATLLVVLLATILFDCLAIAKPHPESDRGICGAVDIRNTLDSFYQLKGCRVVEGFVQIMFFDVVNESELSRISFPDLVEITDYLLVFKVNELQSLGQLFPNLAVIRGQNTFYGYSLVIYEMPSLQEISLNSLTDITRGYIRIDKNPLLCFVSSIDWNRIVHEKDKDSLYIKSLKPAEECPICPEDKKEEKNNTTTSKSCPKVLSNFGTESRLCWNRQHCQKICPSSCKNSCNANGECCNENCLGGCRLDNVDDCTVCKNVTMVVGPRKQCMLSCPEGYYQFRERRCVKKNECISMKSQVKDKSYNIHNNLCVLECPQNFVSVDHFCVPCQGACKSELNNMSN